jgi:hypothetical protein
VRSNTPFGATPSIHVAAARRKKGSRRRFTGGSTSVHVARGSNHPVEEFSPMRLFSDA